MGEKREPFDGKCKDCDHVWTIAYTPMEMTKFCDMAKNARCPMCGCGAENISVNFAEAEFKK